MKRLLTIYLILLCVCGIAQTQGPFTPSGAASNGGGNASWVGLTNSASANDAWVSVSGLNNNAWGDVLLLTDFGFTIPANVTITGVEVNVEGANQTGTCKKYYVQLIVGGVPKNPKKGACSDLSSGDVVTTYGGSADLWFGAGPTLLEINDGANFGVAIQPQSSSTTSDFRVDLVDVKVYFTVPLPIELVSFTVKPLNGSVLVNWVTATEVNNDRFILENSHDGVNFNFLYEINGAGNSNKERRYSYIDGSPYVGDNYYRLTQIDFDGNSETFDIITTQILEVVVREMSVYPSPVTINNNINVKFSGIEGEEILVVVLDIHGRIRHSKVVVTNTIGNSIHTIDPHGKIPSGTYIIVGSTNNDLYKKKIIIK